jgi:histidine triad (HIT) family protein
MPYADMLRPMEGGGWGINVTMDTLGPGEGRARPAVAGAVNRPRAAAKGRGIQVAKVRMTARGRGRASHPGCIFCRIVASQAPVSTVFEDGRVLAFMDTSPVRQGHVLVIPKAHRAQIWDVADAEFAAVYRTLPTLVRALARATGADAVNVLNLNGRAGGQTVFHVHFHLIPIHRDRSPLRREGRRITLELLQQPTSRVALDRIARRIRGHLAGARSPGLPSPR